MTGVATRINGSFAASPFASPLVVTAADNLLAMTQPVLWLEAAVNDDPLAARLRIRNRSGLASIAARANSDDVANVASAFSGLPAIDFPGSSGDYMSFTFDLPANYFVAAWLQLDADGQNHGVFSCGEDAADRMDFYVNSSDEVALQHGTGSSDDLEAGSVSASTPYVLAGGYYGGADAEIGTQHSVAVFVNSLTAAGSGVLTKAHAGASTCSLGAFAAGAQPSNMKLGGLCVWGQPYHLDSGLAARTSIMQALAAKTGIAIAGV